MIHGASQPSNFSELPIEEAAGPENRAYHYEVPVSPLKFRHIREIHPIYPGDRRRYCQNSGPCSKAANDGVLLRLSHHQTCLESKRQELPQTIYLLLHAPNVISHVTKQRLHLRIDRFHLGVLQPPANFNERHHCISKSKQITPQIVQSLYIGFMRPLIEDGIFDPIDFSMDRFDHGHVVINDEVENGVKDIIFAMGQHLGTGFAALPNG